MSAIVDAIRSRRGRWATVVAGAVVASGLAIPLAGPAAAGTGPSTPGGFTATQGATPSTVALAWTASSDPLGIVGYQIWRQAGTGTNTLIATTDGTVKKYTATHLYGSTNYTFQVIALDTAPAESAPATATITTPASTASGPTAPAPSSVAVHPFSDSRIDIVWGASTDPDVSGYQVLRDNVVVGHVDLPGGLHYSDATGLSPATAYHYSIATVDSAGNVSAPTASKVGTTLASGTVKIARGPYVSNVTASSAIVSWWTNIPTTGQVNYGTPSPSSSKSDANSTVHHAVTLTGLAPGSTYQYTVGDGTTQSNPATFDTAAAPGTPFSFAAIGDFGGASPGEAQNATNIAGAGTSFIQTVGDNIYPSAGLPDPDFATTYSDFDARFFKQFGPALSKQAFFPANGNQEYYANGAFWNAFPMPGGNHAWYSYDWGNAHITVLDSQLPYDTASAQYAWLQNDLSTHQSATFRIVIVQAPAHSSSSVTASSKPIQNYLVPVFEQQHVALVLSGNSHNYERTNPINGVTYVVTGGGGNGHNAFNLPQPSTTAFRDATSYEYVKVNVSPSAIKLSAMDAATNSPLDSATIAAPPTAPGAPTIGTASPVTATSALVNWSAPASDGGSPITQYIATATPGSQSCSTLGTSCTVSGLTPGSTYTFSVVAKNVVGPSTASAASNPVTLHVPTALVVTSAPKQAVGGSFIRLTGTLTRTDTSATVAGHAVQLQYRPLGSKGAFTTLPAVHSTSAAGVVGYRVKLVNSMQYRLTMAADSTYNAATSGVRNVSAVHRITIARSAKSVLLHHGFRITGQVSPASSGARIFLQRKLGTKWSAASSTLVSPASTYSFGLRAPARGKLIYRTMLRGGNGFAASYSPATLVTAR